MILDTTTIIDILRGNEEILNKIKGLENKNEPLMTTSISVFEIWQGNEDISNIKKRKKIQELLNSLITLNFDVDSAKEAGSIHGMLRKKGRMIDPEDSMIAGIAKVQNEKVLTRNVSHFQRIEGITIESY